MERRIKRLSVLAVVLLLVTIALYYLLPPSPVAAVAVGLLWGIGASIPIGCLLAIWTTPKPLVVSKPKRYTATQDGQWVTITDDAGKTTTVDLLATFGPAALIDAPADDDGYDDTDPVTAGDWLDS